MSGRFRWTGRALAGALAALAMAPAGFPQGMEGRVVVRVTDPDGRGAAAAVELASRSPEFVATAVADSDGRAVLRRVPPGLYRLTVRHPGFEVAERRVEVRSAVPLAIEVALRLATVAEAITVAAPPPLMEPNRPSQPTRANREFLEQNLGTTLGRSTVDVVTTMPGWLLEANAVLHPRGSEYDTQYVVDGMPLYDNRSIAFAPAFESSEFEAVTVFTAGIPAEYGRRLGGVIALDTRRAPAAGHRFAADLLGGGYGTRTGAFSHQWARRRTAVDFGLHGGATDRYLDPPSLENFTNAGSAGGANARVARDVSGRDRLTVLARTSRTGFLVPNDLVQQEAGQRQDRRSAESVAQVHYQGAISSRSLLSARGMLRSLTSELWSNEFATPVFVEQDRGFREGVAMADLTVDGERHTIKIGGDVRLSGIRESFLLAEPDDLPDSALDFADRRRSVDASAFVQGTVRLGGFGASLGLRVDHHSLIISATEASPRLAASYYLRRPGVQLYASYDRVFQSPPFENLLLSSAAPGFGLDAVEGGIAVPPSRANFFEVGARKAFGDALRLDVKRFWRSFRNPIDDDVFLNTGLSFPITFDSARIQGFEARLDTPRWRGLSAVASYSNLVGVARSPVTGGLFIEGGEAEELRDVAVEFPISQDQRNTVAAMLRFEFSPRIWAFAGVRYGSGLPIEVDDDDDDDDDGDEEGDDDGPAAGGAIPQAILAKVDLERGRVLPGMSLDFGFGARVWERGHRSATLHFDLRNAADRLNVINFSGLFSGTALAPGRQASVRLRLRF